MEEQNISEESGRSNHEESPEQEKSNLENPSHEDVWTSFMFGSGPRHPTNIQQNEPPANRSYIDYEELMGNIDTLVVSVRNLKPLFQKVYPYIEQIWKKK
jgi:hypothetical protein